MSRRPLLALPLAGVAAALVLALPALGSRQVGGPASTGPIVMAASTSAANPATALWDSKAGSAILTATNLRPGPPAPPLVGQVTIRNVVAPSQVGLQETAVRFTCPASRTYPRPAPANPASGTGCVASSPGYGQGDLSSDLRLTVTDATTGRLVFAGLFNASGGAAPGSASLASAVQVCGAAVTARNPCPAWSNGESHTFTFQVTLPNGPRTGAENAYQGTTASSTFVWGNL